MKTLISIAKAVAILFILACIPPGMVIALTIGLFRNLRKPKTL